MALFQARQTFCLMPLWHRLLRLSFHHSTFGLLYRYSLQSRRTSCLMRTWQLLLRRLCLHPAQLYWPQKAAGCRLQPSASFAQTHFSMTVVFRTNRLTGSLWSPRRRLAASSASVSTLPLASTLSTPTLVNPSTLLPMARNLMRSTCPTDCLPTKRTYEPHQEILAHLQQKRNHRARQGLPMRNRYW